MPTKEAQISVRLPKDLNQWVEEQAGGKREKPAFIRHLLERHRHAEEEAAMQQMFDEAWDSLPASERAEVEAERTRGSGGSKKVSVRASWFRPTV